MDEAPEPRPEGVPLRLDPEPESAEPSLPAFLARPEGAPVYYGFPLLEASRTPDGWCFGTISDPNCPEGLDGGDAFVVAPDGSRAGIVWGVGEATLEVILPPEEDRWGVYGLGLARPVYGDSDLVEQLRGWLPELRRLHRKWTLRPPGTAGPHRLAPAGGPGWHNHPFQHLQNVLRQEKLRKFWS